MAAAMQDPEHPVCKGEYRANRRPNSKTAGVGRVDHDICSMDRFDRILRDPVLKTLHQSPAGGNFLYVLQPLHGKMGTARGGILYNGGYPEDRHRHCEYDHTHGRFLPSSTRSV